MLNRTFFANSGTEAVEGALKLARLATGRGKFLFADSSFHGKGFGSLSVTGRRKYQA
jgi:putrescine aminotransferase